MKKVTFRTVVRLMTVLILAVFASISYAPSVFALTCGPLASMYPFGSYSTLSSYNSYFSYMPKVGGVSLDQAATFLADMSDIKGAYFDTATNRVVFVGIKNTSTPVFNKDDLAVAVKSVIFENTLPAVDIAMPVNGSAAVSYLGPIQNTNFGLNLEQSDYALKLYGMGLTAGGQTRTSTVSSYKSVFDRYLLKGAAPNSNSISRFWISPQSMVLNKDDNTNSFVFSQSVMQVQTQPLSSGNDPNWNAAAAEYVQDLTNNYDAYAQETSEWKRTKELGKIVAVIKWLKDNNIATDYTWAKNYTPTAVTTPTSVPAFTRSGQSGNVTVTMSGGVEYYQPNTYATDNGSSAALKNAAQNAATSPEATHWEFTDNGQQYTTVAVAANAFRSVGAYSTTVNDYHVKTRGNTAISFNRSYSSLTAGQKGIGRGWDMMPARLINNQPWNQVSCSPAGGYSGNYPKQLIFQTLDGGYETFTYTCGNGYQADQSYYHSRIERNTDGSYYVITKDQKRFLFGSDLKLYSIKDSNLNKTDFYYDTSGRLNQISDAENHNLTIAYNGQGLVSTLTDWAGRVVSYNYDASGNLTTVTDPKNNTVTYGYDSSNRLTSATDRQNRQLFSQTYNDASKLARVTDSSNLTINYIYDENNRIATVTDGNQRVTKKYYDNRGRTTQDIDPYLNTIAYTYGSEPSPLTVTDKRNNILTYTYDSSGNVASVTYPNNKQITYQYNALNLVTQIGDGRYGSTPKVTSFTYDTSGNMLSKTEGSITSTSTYDEYGRVLTTIDGANHTTQYTYTTFGNQESAIAPTGGVTLFTYDNLGRLTQKTDENNNNFSYAYDNNNNVLTSTDSVGATTFTYSADNRLLTSVTPDNKTTQFAYDAKGSQTSTTDASTQLTSYGYDQYANMVSRQDSLNHTTQYAYDNLNRKTQATTPLGKVAKWEYDANGNITKRIDESNRSTVYEHDNLNRLTKITYPDNSTITYTYDDRGNPLTIVGPSGTSTYTYDLYDRLLTETDPNNATIQYSYDSADNITQVKYPDNKTVDYSFDTSNRLRTVTDWNGDKTVYQYNPNGTLQYKFMPNGLLGTYAYDASNRLASLQYTKDQQLITRYSYTRDARDNVTTETESKPATSTTFTVMDEGLVSGWSDSYSWGSTINLADTASSNTGSKSAAWTSNASSAGLHLRKTSGTFDTTGYSSVTVAIKATGASARIGLYAKGATDNNLTAQPIDLALYGGNPATSGYTTYTIPLSHLNAASQQISGLNFVNISGGAQAKVYIDTLQFTTVSPSPLKLYGESMVSLLEDWSWGSTRNFTDTAYSYTGANSLGLTYTEGYGGLALQYPNGFSTKGYGYLTLAVAGPVEKNKLYVQFTNANGNPNGQIKSLTNYGGVSDSDNFTLYRIPLSDLSAVDTMVYGILLSNETNSARPKIYIDDVRLMPEVTASVTSADSTFTYDSLNRVLSVTYPNKTYNYTYDAAGNRLTSTENGTTWNYTYNNDNQMLSQNTRTFTYDNQGNQITDNNKTLAYDFDDKLTSWTNPSSSTTITYTYDAAGNRIAKQVGSTTYRYVNQTSDDLSKVLTVKNISTSATTFYLYGSELIGHGDAGSSSRQYYLKDGFGNIRYTTSNTGSTLQSYTYDPYGKKLSGANMNFMYQSEQIDTEDSLYYLRARYYDPTTGRFVSKDPVAGTLSDAQTQNGYSYANNNPINMADPSGQNAVSDWFSGVGRGIKNFFSSDNSTPLCEPPSTMEPGYGSLSVGGSAAEARAEAARIGVKIPDNYVAERADNGKGWVFRAPGSQGNANIIRVAEPTSDYPTGYVRVYNESGQPLNAQGKPGAAKTPETHFRLRPTFRLPFL